MTNKSVSSSKKQVLAKAVRDNQENGARQAVLEDLFNDFNRNRFTVYKFNFFRGIFFGLGSVIGGTIVVALIIWLLTILGNFFPPIDSFLTDVTNTIRSRPR